MCFCEHHCIGITVNQYLFKSLQTQGRVLTVHGMLRERRDRHLKPEVPHGVVAATRAQSQVTLPRVQTHG